MNVSHSNYSFTVTVFFPEWVSHRMLTWVRNIHRYSVPLIFRAFADTHCCWKLFAASAVHSVKPNGSTIQRRRRRCHQTTLQNKYEAQSICVEYIDDPCTPQFGSHEDISKASNQYMAKVKMNRMNERKMEQKQIWKKLPMWVHNIVKKIKSHTFVRMGMVTYSKAGERGKISLYCEVDCVLCSRKCRRKESWDSVFFI